MRYLISILILFSFSLNTFAQQVGDYRSNGSGNWTNASVWQVFNGTFWTTASSFPTSGNVTLRSPHTITETPGLYANSQFALNGNLTINSGATLNFAVGTGGRPAAVTFSVNNLLVNGNVNGPSANNKGLTLRINGDAFFSAGNFLVNPGDTGNSFTHIDFKGDATFLSTSFTSFPENSGFYFTGADNQDLVVLRELPSTTRSRFYVNNSNTVTEIYASTTETQNTVNGNAAPPQLGSAVPWQNKTQNNSLEINNSNGVLLSTNRTIANELILKNGSLNFNGQSFSLANNALINRSGGSLAQAPNFLGNIDVLYTVHNSALTTGLEIPNAENSLRDLIIENKNGIKTNKDIYVNRELLLAEENPNATDGLLDLVINYGNYAQTAYGSDPNFADSTQPFNNLNSYVLYMNANSFTTGIGDVTGKIKRTSIQNQQVYDFGNPNTRLSFNSPTGASGLPETILFTVTRGDFGEHIDNLSEDTELFLFDEDTGEALMGPRSAVKRLYQVQYTAASSLPGSTRFTLRMAYQKNELNTNQEENLITWDHHLPYNGVTPHEHGRTATNVEEAWVELSNHSVLYLTQEGATSGAGTITKYWMLSEKETIGDYVWLGAVDGGTDNWNIVSNWSGGKVPNQDANVFIPSNYSIAPTLTESSGYGDANQENPGFETGEVRLRSLEIAPNASLEIVGSPNIYLYGGPNASGGGINFSTLNNLGTMIPGNSTFHILDDETASEATLVGNLTFYNLQVDADAKVSVQSNSEIEIQNFLIVPSSSNFNAKSNQNTFVFTGTNQQIPNPGTEFKGYYNLTLNGNNSSLPSEINLSGNLRVEEEAIDFDTTRLLFEGSNQSVESDTNLFLSFNEVVIDNNTELTSNINELEIHDLQLVFGKLKAGVNQKINLMGQLNRDFGQLDGLGTFEFTDPNIIEDDLFADNRALANLILNIPDTTFIIPNEFAVEGNLHLEAGDINLHENSLELGGDLTSNLGKIDARQAHIQFSSNNLQEISGNAFVQNTIKEITTIGNGETKLVSKVNLTRALKPESGVFNTNSQLTLKSDENFTAVVGAIGANADVIGRVEVEQFIPARRAFRFLSPTVNTSESIRSNWQEDASSYDDDPHPGFGTHITGTQQQSPNPGNLDGLKGFDWNPSGNPSLFVFDNLNQEWKPVDNTSQKTLEVGEAYRLLVRGSRSVDITSNATTPDNTVLRTFGVLGKNTYLIDNLLNATEKPNFVGNPYQAPIDLSLVLQSSNNLNNFVQIWDPNLGGQNPVPGQPGGRGAFTTIDVISNSSSNQDSDANRFLQPGQGAFFYAASSSLPVEISFHESHKVTDVPQTEVFSTNADATELAIKLYDKNSFDNANTSVDAMLIKFSPEFNEFVDANDALKFENVDENLARLQNGKLLSIEQRPLPTHDEILNLFINQFRHQDYVIQVDATFLPSQMKVFLEDQYLNETIDLEAENFVYEFSVDQNINASIAINRFNLRFEDESLGISKPEKTDFVIYPNPIADNQFQIKSSRLANETAIVSIFDLVGKQVFSEKVDFDAAGNKAFKEFNLKTGIYLLQVQHADFQISKKIIVK